MKPNKKRVPGDQFPGAPGPDWKKFDIKEAVKADISAAVSLLMMLRDNPDLLNIVCTEIELWRKTMIENEAKKPK